MSKPIHTGGGHGGPPLHLMTTGPAGRGHEALPAPEPGHGTVTERFEHVAANVARLRQARGLSQAGLEGRLGWSRGEIGQVERGRRGLSVERLCALAAGLGVRAGDLLAPPPDEEHVPGKGELAYCAGCGQPFRKGSPRAKYHHPSCRVKAFLARKGVTAGEYRRLHPVKGGGDAAHPVP